jgi:signal peptidase I
VPEIRLRGSLSWLGQVLAWLVILGVVVILAAAVLVPRLSGATPYTVLTGSMAPTYPPGTLVVVKPVDQDRVRVGDVVTYQLESGKPAVVTHRVTDITHNLAGKTRFTTQGDANESADVEPVRPEQVRGELWYSMPYLGYVNDVISAGQRQWAVLIVAVGLIGYAAAMFVAAFGERRTRTRPRHVTS